MVFRRDDPAETPAGHVEVFGEARDHERIVGKIERAPGRVIVGEAEIDFVDDQPPVPLTNRRNDAFHFVAADARARRIRWRCDQNAARGWRPILLDQLCGELIIRLGTDGNTDGLAFQNADEMARARIARIREQNAIVAVHEQRVD